MQRLLHFQDQCGRLTPDSRDGLAVHAIQIALIGGGASQEDLHLLLEGVNQLCLLLDSPGLVDPVGQLLDPFLLLGEEIDGTIDLRSVFHGGPLP